MRIDAKHDQADQEDRCIKYACISMIMTRLIGVVHAPNIEYFANKHQHFLPEMLSRICKTFFHRYFSEIDRINSS